MTTTNEIHSDAPPGEEATRDTASLTLVTTTDSGPGVRGGERGMVSAEWAVGIIAAIGIAGVLLAVVTSGPVEDAILEFVLRVIRAFARGL
jgi:hypothetical protein